MHSLPTSVVADLVREANHRLHFDPVHCLPQEIISSIFEHLPPKSLCIASLASRAWQLRAQDPRLWRQRFVDEGWSWNLPEMRALEEMAKLYKRQTLAETVSVLEHIHANHQRASYRRQSLQMAGLEDEPDGAFDLPDMLLDIGVPPAPISRLPFPQDVDMPDISTLPPPTSIISASRPLTLPRFSKLLTMDPIFDQPTLNWQYLYTQRRRLERNWSAGRFTNFRLPHPSYPEERHTQCVYTIQFSQHHLVSGSRDKSVRVWDLRTQRLRLPPLEGHTGSVLCLQFDERPEQDIIISGGSDADVIVWRFSDGAMIKRMGCAHSESVLNLRFDERYLVTCSKDKTIKVWNRHSLMPNDADYPNRTTGRNAQYPHYIIDPREVERMASPPAPLEPFTHLMTFNEHQAAVNALQIRDYEIVSASGDRKVMLWNIKTGELVRTFAGHQKGIACIQYDGRRVVSGSSDNTVRIFDAATAAEVALLDGHRNLVRTVQAEFGDLSFDNQENEAEARANDQRIKEEERRKALENNAASDRPEEDPSKPYVLGARLPPGGGGTQWSKIVSGSYDETLIIWRRDKTGRWFIAKELRQEDALRASSRGSTHLRRPSGDLTRMPQHSSAQDSLRHRLQSQWHMLQVEQQHRQALLDSLGPHSRHRPMPPFTGQRSELPVAPSASGMHPPMPPPQASAAAAAATSAHHHHAHHHPPRPPGTQPQPAGTNTSQPPWQGTLNRPVRPHHHHPHAHHHHLQASTGGQVPSLNNRVFKLQFDARRIVCCSQEPVIVGWDFANGDREIEEACRFFGEPS